MKPDDIVFELRMVQRTIEELKADVRENFRLISELKGATTALELNKTQLKHTREIGEIIEAIRVLRTAMSKSEDKKLADAAKDININIDNTAANK